MSKLTDIKYRIDQLDGGRFQNLCDSYLFCRGYGPGYSLGMNTGTDKTAKGNPDTYFITTNQKYIFVMYTTQKTGFVTKVMEDIDKCFDSSKTGLAPEDVVGVVYCHTYGRLLPGEHQSLSKYCESHNAVLTLIGLDELANDLFIKYPRLAKDFLGISVDTGQITTVGDFVHKHDLNKLAAPLRTTFLFRDSEIKEAVDKLDCSDILMISGPAGVGKTRLALHICEQLSEKEDYEVLCIRSNGSELYEDLTTTLEAGKDYLVFVDDANELTGLRYVLDYLLQEGPSVAHIKKLIISVRDYSRHQVLQQVLDIERSPGILRLGLLNDENIKALVKSVYGITNPRYLERIATIADGNARLAMLAGKVASDANTLESIRDATQLYDNYYGKQIGIITDSKTGIISVGIMAFFQKIHLEKIDRLTSIIDLTNLTQAQFYEDLRSLHEKELVDLCQNKAARISDQSFSNYLIKYVFVDKKIIPLSKMIEVGFFYNKARTIEACNILFNVFSDDSSHKYIKDQISIVWSNLENDTEKFLPFFRSFHMVRPNDTLILLNKWIDNVEYQEYDISTVILKENDSNTNIKDDIIRILCSFENHEQLPEAVELLFLYYQKRPDLIKQVYAACTYRLGVNKDSSIHGYYSQQIVIDQLCSVIDSCPTNQNLKLFVGVAEQYLKLVFRRTEGGRRNTVTIYTIPLTKTDMVIRYRERIITHLISIYHSGKYQSEIEDLLYNYCRKGGHDVDCEIVKCDLHHIFRFFEELNPEYLYHCAIAKHMSKVSASAGFDYGELLIPYFESSKYTIYEGLKENLFEMRELSYDERIDVHKQRVHLLVKNYKLEDFIFLFDVCSESLESVDRENRQLSSGLEYAIDSIEENQELYLEVIEAYLKANTPYNIYPAKILSHLFRMMSPNEVKTFITRHNFSQKNSWFWAFYTELPENQIDEQWTCDLLEYLSSPPSELTECSLRPIDRLKKYEKVNKDILVLASEALCKSYNKSPFVFHLYFDLMLNPYHRKDIDILPCYKEHIGLLEDIYLKCLAYSHNNDSDGKVLALIVDWDLSFLYRYIDECVSEAKKSFRCGKEWAKRLQFIWEDDRYIERAFNISEHLMKLSGGSVWSYSSIMEYLLQEKQENSGLCQRQDEWIRFAIQQYSNDEDRMRALFTSIVECSQNRRKQALGIFLERNSDFAIFEHLPLEPSHWGGVGSMIPHMQKRITYLTSLLPMMSGSVFLQHKKRVLHEIGIWEGRIKSEEINELLESLG